MSAVYSIFTSPDHPQVRDHLPTLIVTPLGQPQKILYTYLHTSYNSENYLFTPSPDGDLCVAKLSPPAAPPRGKTLSEGHATPALRSVKCEASRNFKWSITNSGVLTPTYKCTLPADDMAGGVGEDQPLFQISKTNPQSPFWTMWYYAYAGHLIPPKRIQFGHISKTVGPDGKPITGGGTRVTVTGKTDDEKAVWKTLGEGNEDMVEWAVVCAALHVLDDEIMKAAQAAGIRIGEMPGASRGKANGPLSVTDMPRPQIHPTGQRGPPPPVQSPPMIPNSRGPPPHQQQLPPPQIRQPVPAPGPPPSMSARGPLHPAGPPIRDQRLAKAPTPVSPPPMSPMRPYPGPGQGPGPGPAPGQTPFPAGPVPRDAHSMSPPNNGMPLLPNGQMPPPRQMSAPPDAGRPRMLSNNGPRPRMPPPPGVPQDHIQASPSGMRAPLPPIHVPPQRGPNGMMSPPPPHIRQPMSAGPMPGPPMQNDRPIHGLGARPGPLAQQNYPMGGGPGSSRMPFPAPGQAPPGPGRSAPPAGLSALRSRSPLPTPGSAPPGVMNGQATAHVDPRQRLSPPGSTQPLRSPARAQPPPRPELREEDTVDSVAFMLGATALNDSLAHDEVEGIRSRQPVNGHQPAKESRVQRMLKNRP